MIPTPVFAPRWQVSLFCLLLFATSAFGFCDRACNRNCRTVPAAERSGCLFPSWDLLVAQKDGGMGDTEKQRGSFLSANPRFPVVRPDHAASLLPFSLSFITVKVEETELPANPAADFTGTTEALKGREGEMGGLTRFDGAMEEIWHARLALSFDGEGAATFPPGIVNPNVRIGNGQIATNSRTVAVHLSAENARFYKIGEDRKTAEAADPQPYREKTTFTFAEGRGEGMRTLHICFMGASWDGNEDVRWMEKRILYDPRPPVIDAVTVVSMREKEVSLSVAAHDVGGAGVSFLEVVNLGEKEGTRFAWNGNEAFSWKLTNGASKHRTIEIFGVDRAGNRSAGKRFVINPKRTFVRKGNAGGDPLVCREKAGCQNR